MEIVLRYARETAGIFNEMAVYLLLGFLVAGLLAVLLPRGRLAGWVGGRGWGPALRAALLGVPLPLCSCSVLPTAFALRRRGAGRGATVSFLISTPETSIDSIAVTYALMDPLITLFRPLAAVATAVVGGVLTDACDSEPAPSPAAETCAICGLELLEGHDHSATQKLRRIFSYAFGDLFADLALWLLIGVAMAGLIATFVPLNFFDHLPGGELAAMAIILLIGIPLYSCATASTPIAAALVAKGLSPGVALVLLLVGPATNLATILAVGKNLGRRTLALYLTTVAGMSVLLGLLLNRLYPLLHLSPRALTGSATELLPGWAELLASAVLLALGARLLLRRLALRRRAGSAPERQAGCGCSVEGAETPH